MSAFDVSREQYWDNDDLAIRFKWSQSTGRPPILNDIRHAMEAGSEFTFDGIGAGSDAMNTAAVAQLVERSPCKREVAGSIPCRWHHTLRLRLG